MLFHLAYECEMGIGREKDKNLARNYYIEAMRLRHVGAYVCLALLYENGEVEVVRSVADVLALYRTAISISTDTTAAPYHYKCLALAEYGANSIVVNLETSVKLELFDCYYGDIRFVFLALRALKPFNGRCLVDNNRADELKKMLMEVANDADFEINRYCPVTTDHSFRLALATGDAEIIGVFLDKKPNWHLQDSDHLSLYQRILLDLSEPCIYRMDVFDVPIISIRLSAELRDKVTSRMSAQYAASIWRVSWSGLAFTAKRYEQIPS